MSMQSRDDGRDDENDKDYNNGDIHDDDDKSSYILDDTDVDKRK